MKNGWIKLSKFVLTRAMIFYAAVFLLSLFIIDYSKITFAYKIRVLNLYVPQSFAFLINAVEKGATYNISELSKATVFYQKVVDFFPEQADSWAMLGFCYFHGRNFNKSQDAFEKAIQRQPDVFWYYYNPGILYFRSGDYEKAANFLLKAQAQDASKTLNYIKSSNVIYRMIIQDAKVPMQEISRRLSWGYQSARILLLEALWRSKNYEGLLSQAEQWIAGGREPAGIFHLYAGLAHHSRESWDIAQKHFEACIQINPEVADAYSYLALCLKSKNIQDNRINALEKASRQNKVSLQKIVEQQDRGLRIF